MGWAGWQETHLDDVLFPPGYCDPSQKYKHVII